MKTFHQTDDRPYDRHVYRVVFKDGSAIDLNTYQEVQFVWANYQDPDRVIVVDTGGF